MFDNGRCIFLNYHAVGVVVDVDADWNRSVVAHKYTPTTASSPPAEANYFPLFENRTAQTDDIQYERITYITIDLCGVCDLI